MATPENLDMEIQPYMCLCLSVQQHCCSLLLGSVYVKKRSNIEQIMKIIVLCKILQETTDILTLVHLYIQCIYLVITYLSSLSG